MIININNYAYAHTQKETYPSSNFLSIYFFIIKNISLCMFDQTLFIYACDDRRISHVAIAK